MDLLFGALAIGLVVVLALAVLGRRSRKRADAAEAVWLDGRGAFDFEVVGESHYQERLSEICGGPCEAGHRMEVEAELVQERGNPHDRQAVAVRINGQTVAYLSRKAARAYRERLRALGFAGRRARCRAVIVGGWLRPRRSGRVDEGAFGVKLDLA